MKRIVCVLIFFAMFFSAMATSYADRGDWRGGIRSRIHEAQQRIEWGIDRGSLTRHEARRLERELGQILRKIEMMRDDGHLDRWERERIDRDLDRLDRQITREKRDDQRRYHRDGYYDGYRRHY